jgi:hypothetical protein
MKGTAPIFWNAVCADCGWINSSHSQLCSRCYAPLSTQAPRPIYSVYSQVPYAPVFNMAAPVSDIPHPRSFAGSWFAVAGALASFPVWLIVLVLSYSGGTEPSVALPMAFLPTVVAGLIGSCYGSSILTSSRVTTWRHAVARGILVGCGSLAFYLCVLADVVTSTPSNSFGTYLGALVYLEFFGFIFTGWLVCAVGGLAGLLLFNVYRAEKIEAAQRRHLHPTP